MGDLSPMTTDEMQKIVNLFNSILRTYKGTIQFVNNDASTSIRGAYKPNPSGKDTITITIEKEFETRCTITPLKPPLFYRH